MTLTNNESRKSTAFKTSEQVKEILHEKGFSKIFNYADFDYFKKQCKNTFNKAQAIAERFIQDYNDIPSDYNDYVY